MKSLMKSQAQANNGTRGAVPPPIAGIGITDCVVCGTGTPWRDKIGIRNSLSQNDGQSMQADEGVTTQPCTMMMLMHACWFMVSFIQCASATSCSLTLRHARCSEVRTAGFDRKKLVGQQRGAGASKLISPAVPCRRASGDLSARLASLLV